MIAYTYNANLIEALLRYIDEYKWGWGIARRQLRMRFNVDITVPELQQIYKQAKERPLGAATPNGRVENIPSMTKGVVYFFMLS